MVKQGSARRRQPPAPPRDGHFILKRGVDWRFLRCAVIQPQEIGYAGHIRRACSRERADAAPLC